MKEVDKSRSDREIGATLSGDDVERLRDAIGWLRSNRGFRLTEIARDCDAAEHTMRNFAYRKSIRPDNVFLGKLSKFVLARIDLLPDAFLAAAQNPQPRGRQEQAGRLARVDLIRMEVPISEDDIKRVFDRFSGYYLCFRPSYRQNRMSVSWLHILPLNRRIDPSKDGLPLPRFTLLTEYSDPVDPATGRSYIVAGYVIRRSGRLYLVGQNDGNLKYFMFKEPPNTRFTYLQGLSLLSSVEDGEPFAGRVVCQFLGRDANREDWRDRIGVFPDSEFSELFDNASNIKRVIGDDAVLTA